MLSKILDFIFPSRPSTVPFIMEEIALRKEAAAAQTEKERADNNSKYVDYYKRLVAHYKHTGFFETDEYKSIPLDQRHLDMYRFDDVMGKHITEICTRELVAQMIREDGEKSWDTRSINYAKGH